MVQFRSHFCGCSVVSWCYLLLFFDAFLGLGFAMKHYDFFGATHEEKSVKKSFLDRMEDSKCTDLGLGPIAVIVEMSLLVVVVLAICGLCCRRAVLLVPYLIYKVLIVFLTIYMIIQYILHFEDCRGFLLAQVIGLLISLVIYSIVAGAFHVIRTESKTSES